MLRPALLGLLAVLSSRPGVGLAADFPYAGLFDRQGVPLEWASQWQRTTGAPRLIKGVDIPMARPGSDGKWEILGFAACIVAGFHVSSDGSVDKIMILDSSPKDALTPAVHWAMSQWRFENGGKTAWAVLPLKFSLGGVDPQGSWFGVQTKPSDLIGAEQEHCLVPVRKREFNLPAGVELSGEEADPVYPRAELLRAHPVGCVTVAFRIAADGVPVDLELLEAKPDQSFVDVAAIDVQSRRFKVPPVAEGGKSRFGFARLGYGTDRKDLAIPSCMTAAFAAQHYQPSEPSP